MTKEQARHHLDRAAMCGKKDEAVVSALLGVGNALLAILDVLEKEEEIILVAPIIDSPHPMSWLSLVHDAVWGDEESKENFDDKCHPATAKEEHTNKVLAAQQIRYIIAEFTYGYITLEDLSDTFHKKHLDHELIAELVKEGYLKGEDFAPIMNEVARVLPPIGDFLQGLKEKCGFEVRVNNHNCECKGSEPCQ